MADTDNAVVTASGTADAVDPASRRASLRGAAGATRILTLLALTVLAGVVFSLLGQGFLSDFTLYALGQAVAVSALVGLAQAALLVLGRINLAVGGVGVVVSATIGVLDNNSGIPLLWIVVIALVVGAVTGALMAVVEIYSRLNSFVVTLAFLSVYQGGVLLITQAAHYPITIPELLSLGTDQIGFSWLSPMLVVAVAVCAVLWVFYFRTVAGWRAQAVGANERAAAASGINVRRAVVLGYVISGLLSAVAAVLVCAQLADAAPTTGGDWLLLSFVGPLLAGVLLTGGTISVWGILVGGLFYASIFSGFAVLNVPTYWLTLLQAAVLLLALVLGQTSLVRRPRRSVPGGPR
ncbi:ABC transporter permease [Nakamurella flavida]|uniref:ABC transporter permease n=1 Tax=Nakamurella flavida TaxID=363630 RepID=A0A938YFH4_9ACTN|nr:ABC transporter permease [Nakamurella flavida]MBM9476721.1 ABC transporter permease [Nakamurella flavida]MDP9778841.1 ribose transport system permease protein [Nakamurella flavida]